MAAPSRGLQDCWGGGGGGQAASQLWSLPPELPSAQDTETTDPFPGPQPSLLPLQRLSDQGPRAREPGQDREAADVESAERPGGG